MTINNVSKPGNLHKYRIRGKVVLTRNEKLFSHLDKVTETIVGHLKRGGLRDVSTLNGNWILFSGRKMNLLTFVNLRRRDFKNLVDKGAIKVSLEGSAIVAEYYASTLKGWTIEMSVYSAILIPTFLFSPIIGEHFQYLTRIMPYLLLFMALNLGLERFIKIQWALRRELKHTVNTAENVIASLVGMHDISSVEPKHREQGPGDLLKSAYFYLENGFTEKSRAYLALLLEKYPWTHQANSARELLETQDKVS